MKRPAVAESKIGNQCQDRTPLARRSCSREIERPSRKSCGRWKKSKNGRPKNLPGLRREREPSPAQ
jgi:hypothetical protein